MEKNGAGMRMREFSIDGFRSLKSVVWRPGGLNVLIGPNGSGKSNLVKALGLLSRSASGKLYETMVGMGGVSPLLWDGQVDEIRWKLTLDLEGEIPTYGFSLKYRSKSGTYFLADESLKRGMGHTEGLPAALLEASRRPPVDLRPDMGGFDNDSEPLDAFSHVETILSQTGPFAADSVISTFKRWLHGVTIHHDMPYGEAVELRRPTVSRIEKCVRPDGKNLVAVLHTLYSSSLEFREDFDMAMQAAFDNQFHELVFPPAEDRRIQMRMRWKSLRRTHSMDDLSDGTIRYLLILAILANPAPPPILVIDEPETGLHPAMLPMVAEYAFSASAKCQVVLSTHSAELLNCLGEFDPTVTVFSNKRGQTCLKNCDKEELGRWLKNYSLGNLFLSGELEELI